MFSNFFGPPHLPNGIIKPKQEGEPTAPKSATDLEAKFGPEAMSRRGFLKSVGSVAVAGAVGSFSNDVEAAQFQPSSKEDLELLGKLLNGQTLTHPKPDNKRIFNNPKTLETKYKSGDFTFYEPHDPENSPYKKAFLSKSIEPYDKMLERFGYKVVESKSNFVIVAEVENAGANDSLYYNGMVIIKKGTKIARKNVGTTEKPIFQNWIYDCFNPVYALACMPK